MITIQWPYSLVGLMFGGFAFYSAFDRDNRKRFGNAAFWGLMALSLLAGSWLGDFVNGLLVLALALIGGFGLMGRGAPETTNQGERLTWAQQLGDRLYLPALVIPAVALAGTLAYKYTPLGGLGWIEPQRETFVFLCLGSLLAVGVILAWLTPPPSAALQA